MKKTILFIALSICTCYFVQGQVTHSPYNLELSFGVEGFRSFEPIASSFIFEEFGGSFLGGRTPTKGDLEWRPVTSVSYRKVLNSGNYFGVSATFGSRKWIKRDLDIATFNTLGQPISIKFDEEQKEGTIGLAYVYSFLITRESSNLQFFIGAEGSIYDNFAENTPLNSDAGGSVQRNIFGIRISAVPELMYLFPNSRVTASLRVKLPLIHFERDQQNQRSIPGGIGAISSFFFGFNSTTHHSFDFLPAERSRLELGIGYFLEAQ